MKKFLYSLIGIVLMLLFPAFSCTNEADELAANGIPEKFYGQWRVTAISNQPEFPANQTTITTWRVSNLCVMTIEEVTLPTGIYGYMEQVSKKEMDFEPTLTHVEFPPYAGSFEFANPDKFVITQPDGVKVTFERMPEINV